MRSKPGKAAMMWISEEGTSDMNLCEPTGSLNSIRGVFLFFCMRCGYSINKRVSSSGFHMGSDKPIDYRLRILGIISLWHMIDRAAKLHLLLLQLF